MFKTTLLFVATLAFSSAFVTSNNRAETEEGCLYEHQPWGINYSDSFYYCQPSTNTPVKQTCPPGDFFVRNETIVGCVNIHPYCKFKNELWGSADGTKFYYCITSTNTPITQNCPPDTFFVKNSDVAGCLPLDEVDSNCVYLDQDDPPICTENLAAHPSRDPTKFYLCIAENIAPLKFSCAKGKAFLYQDDHKGCFDWTVWREVRNCPE